MSERHGVTEVHRLAFRLGVVGAISTISEASPLSKQAIGEGRVDVADTAHSDARGMKIGSRLFRETTR
jgi:hypothetical protein